MKIKNILNVVFIITHHCFFLNLITGSPSPAKSRPSLPTSPTHIQAMRYATQQKHGSNALNSIGSTNGMSSGASSAANSPSMVNTLSPLSQPPQHQMNSNQQQPQQHQQQHSPLIANLHQLGFEYNANGLELAGFCSPSGKMQPPQTTMLLTCTTRTLEDTHYDTRHRFAGQSTSGASSSGAGGSGNQASTSQNNIINSPTNGASSGSNSQNFYQYLTPPSQHSGGVTPQHLVQSLDSYPTPSPESPGHWSSSSPHSTSDWSEGVQSPANIYVTGGHQTNKGGDAIYI